LSFAPPEIAPLTSEEEESMRYVVRLMLIGVVGLGLCVGVSRVVIADEYGEGRSLTSWFLSELRRSEALERRGRALSHALAAKRAIVVDLLADKLTVREAADQFMAVDEEVEEASPPPLRTPPRLYVTEESARRQLIGWVKNELGRDSPRTEEVLHRLEEELAQQPSATE
jgi:hypothetical protein